MKLLKLGAVICAASLLSASAWAAKAPTITQSLDMVTVGAPKISPDGRRVIYEQTTTNWETNAFDTTLWMADVATGQTRRLTLAVKSSTAHMVLIIASNSGWAKLNIRSSRWMTCAGSPGPI